MGGPTYRVRERPDGTYDAFHVVVVPPGGTYATYADGGLVGNYQTGAEAVDACRALESPLALTCAYSPTDLYGDHPAAAPGNTSLSWLVYVSGKLPEYLPPEPFDWQCLVPCPKGITFPEVEHSEFIRFLRGGFNGLKLVYTITPDREETGPPDGIGGGGYNYSERGVSVAQAVYVRTAKVKCGQPYCGKAVTYMAPAQVEQFGSTAGGGTVDATATANTTATFTNDEVSTSSTFNIIDSGTPVMRFGFFRASDNTRQVTLFARVYGSGNAYNTKLWAYAPVSGADFHDVYAIPQMPEGEGYSEVGGSLQFLGVTLTVWGWKYTYSYAGDGGPGSISGHLDSTSAFTLTELTET